MTRGDVEDAVSSWGRYRGQETFETFKQRLTRLAKRKELDSALPVSWSETKGGGMDIDQLNSIIAVVDQMARKAKAKAKPKPKPDTEEDILDIFDPQRETKARRMKKKMDASDDVGDDEGDEDFMAMLEEVGRKARRMKKKMDASDDEGDDEGDEDFMAMLEEVGRKAHRMKKKMDASDDEGDEDFMAMLEEVGRKARRI
jgi:hypothetical protein